MRYCEFGGKKVSVIAGASRMEHVLSIGEICDCTITPEQRDRLFSYE